MDMIRFVLRVVIFYQHSRALDPVVLRNSGDAASCPGKGQIVDTRFRDLAHQAFRKIKSSSGQQEAIQTTEELRGVLRREHREDVAEIFQNWNASQFSYLHFPKSHWNRLRDVGSFKQVLREFRETIRIIGPIEDDKTP